MPLLTPLTLIFDPITAPMTYGPYLTCVVLCVGLYIWSNIQNNDKGHDLSAMRESLETHMADDKRFFTAMSDNVSQITSSQLSQREFLEGQHDILRELAKSQSGMSNAVEALVKTVDELSRMQSKVQNDQSVLMTQNQMIMQNFQRIIDTMLTNANHPQFSHS